MKTLIILFVIIGCAGGYWYLSHTYTFVKDYSTTVTVGAVEGLGKVNYNVGDSVWASESADGIIIRIGRHLKIDRSEPDGGAYQEFIVVPYEYVTKYKLF